MQMREIQGGMGYDATAFPNGDAPLVGEEGGLTVVVDADGVMVETENGDVYMLQHAFGSAAEAQDFVQRWWSGGAGIAGFQKVN